MAAYPFTAEDLVDRAPEEVHCTWSHQGLVAEGAVHLRVAPGELWWDGERVVLHSDTLVEVAPGGLRVGEVVLSVTRGFDVAWLCSVIELGRREALEVAGPPASLEALRSRHASPV